MSAKRKLNVAYSSGSLLIAGLLGCAADSFIVFLVALAALVAGAFYLGEIRR